MLLYGRWEDLDKWKWVVIDVGVTLDTSATHSENLFFDIFGAPIPRTVLLCGVPPPETARGSPHGSSKRRKTNVLFKASWPDHSAAGWGERLEIQAVDPNPCYKLILLRGVQNGLREYPELLPHQLRPISTYPHPPVSHMSNDPGGEPQT